MSATFVEGRAADPAGHRRDADVHVAVVLRVDADVVDRSRRQLRRRAVDQRPVQVFGLQHLAETLDAPVGHQELQPGPTAQPPISVVPEHADDAGPDIRYVGQWHPRTEPLREHRVGRQATADPDIEAGAVLRVYDADEADVVDFVRQVGQPPDRRLELARQVGELRVADVALGDLVDGRGRVDHLGRRDPGNGTAEHDARRVATGLRRAEPDALDLPPDRRHVLDADPVHLDVLAVGQVGGVAGVTSGHVGDGAQLGDVELAAVDADAEHEVFVVQLVRLEDGGAAAVDAGLALGVEAEPAEPTTEILRVDARESAVRVDVLDTQARVQPVVVALHALVGVQRLAVTKCPLALAAPALAGGLAAGTRRRPRRRSRLVGDDRHCDPPYGFSEEDARTTTGPSRRDGGTVTSMSGRCAGVIGRPRTVGAQQAGHMALRTRP